MFVTFFAWFNWTSFPVYNNKLIKMSRLLFICTVITALTTVQVSSAPPYNESQTSASELTALVNPETQHLTPRSRRHQPFDPDEISRFTVKRVQAGKSDADDDYYVIYFDPSSDTDADHHKNNFQGLSDDKEAFFLPSGVQKVSKSDLEAADHQNTFFFNLPSLV